MTTEHLRNSLVGRTDICNFYFTRSEDYIAGGTIDSNIVRQISLLAFFMVRKMDASNVHVVLGLWTPHTLVALETYKNYKKDKPKVDSILVLTFSIRIAIAEQPRISGIFKDSI